MRNTLLTIGDLRLDGVKKAPSVNKFIRYRRRLIKKNTKFEFITYDDLLLGRLPDISTKKLKIILFFPYTYWNSNIERYDMDGRIYGDRNFGRDYKKMFLKIDKIINDSYSNKEITYVNSPYACILDRDKQRTAQILSRHGILTPKTYIISSIPQLNKILDGTEALYVKPVFGAMGKGITFITKKNCWTNFIFRGGKIISRPYDYDWEFMKISKKHRDKFLEILIKRGFIFEEAIKFPVVKRRKIDIRVYVVYGRVPYLYARSAPQNIFVTNWSQGGRIETRAFLKKIIPEKKIDEIKRVAKKGARVMGLNYAGIDVMLDESLDKIYFSEAHAFPGYERRFDLMKFLIDRI